MPIWRGANGRKYPNNVIYLVGIYAGYLTRNLYPRYIYVHDPWISRYLIFIQGFVSWDAIYYVTHFKHELWHCHKCQYERALQTYWVPEKGLPLPAEKWWDEQSCKMSQISQIYKKLTGRDKTCGETHSIVTFLELLWNFFGTFLELLGNIFGILLELLRNFFLWNFFWNFFVTFWNFFG